MKTQSKNNPNYVRVYCTKCGKLINTSRGYSKKELRSKWNELVLSAPLVSQCKNCNPDVKMNMYIDLKIFREVLDREVTPKEFGLNVE